MAKFNTLVIILAGLGFTPPSFADEILYICQSWEENKFLDFYVNPENKTIRFRDIHYLGDAQIGVEEEYPYEFEDDSSSTLTFEYDWYYTAEYLIEFELPVVLPSDGQASRVEIRLTYDDADGSSGWKEPFTCSMLLSN